MSSGASCVSSSAWSGDSAHAHNNARESDDRSDCSSEVSLQCHNNNNTGGAARSCNTLLAMSSAPTSPEARNTDPGVEDTPDHPDKIWRRTPIRNEVGRMTSLGRYESGWVVAPDSSTEQGRKSSRISKAVKKLVMNEDHERLKEEMAWQVAEMFVKEVTSVTMSPRAEAGMTRSASLANNYSLTDLSLDMDNLDLPSAKYF